MVIQEYAELRLTTKSVDLPQSQASARVAQLMDRLIVAVYLLGLLGFIPLVVTYAWAKENWSTRDFS
ncbi:MAG: hypothetical protein VKJ64_02480 [Leptolyngbyaceae bacterium]|nr:hypothetical protein [Leptolyngbyaceae bacterium]